MMENYANELEFEHHGALPEDFEVSHRREFLRGLGKWSTAAIAAILRSETSSFNDGAGWVNRRVSPVNAAGSGSINLGREGWLNSRGGGGSWVNRRDW